MDVNISNNVKILKTNDNSKTLSSSVHNSTYHSINGAIQESAHIFINEGLKYYYENTGKDNLSILEFGFGTGLNVLLSLIFSIENKVNVYYSGIDNNILDINLINDLNYIYDLKLDKRYNAYYDIFKINERIIHFSPYFIFEKIVSDFECFVPTKKYQIVYFDTFSSNSQPHLWKRPFLDILPQLMMEGGVLITYSVKGSFRRDLKSLGFDTYKIPGPPGKREITRAIYNGK